MENATAEPSPQELQNAEEEKLLNEIERDLQSRREGSGAGSNHQATFQEFEHIAGVLLKIINRPRSKTRGNESNKIKAIQVYADIKGFRDKTPLDRLKSLEMPELIDLITNTVVPIVKEFGVTEIDVERRCFQAVKQFRKQNTDFKPVPVNYAPPETRYDCAEFGSFTSAQMKGIRRGLYKAYPHLKPDSRNVHLYGRALRPDELVCLREMQRNGRLTSNMQFRLAQACKEHKEAGADPSNL